jgi:hypothetical protein
MLFVNIINKYSFVGFEVLKTVVMKSYTYIFWEIMPRSPLNVRRCFGGSCRLYLQGQRIPVHPTPKLIWFY